MREQRDGEEESKAEGTKEWKKGSQEERKSWMKETAEELRSRALAEPAVSLGGKNRSKPEDEKETSG